MRIPFLLRNFHYRIARKWIKLLTLIFLVVFLLEKLVFHLNGDEFLVDRIRELRLRDYRRYQASEMNRTGPGEQGDPAILTDQDEKIIYNETHTEGFSRRLNDMVSLDRALSDVRHDQCKTLVYPVDLPTVSVVIVYCNELLNVVLRTVHSVINRTPPSYLYEVILVDDASERAELNRTLDEHIEKHWPEGLVKVIRLPERSGLIRTRLAGIKAARGDTFVVMDGHMEVTKGWIEPLLTRMQQNNKTMVASLMDMIEPTNLKYIKSDINYQGFKWNMEFRWLGLPQGYVHDPTKPLPTYGMVGCFMAMNRQMFLDMGGYDTGLEVWGGENVEVPFRIWMCGGRVEIIPCSRVAHTYRAGLGRPWTSPNNDYFGRNTLRVAEVWLDEYIEEYFVFSPGMREHVDEVRAQVEPRKELRKRLGCKSFQWFLSIIQPPMFIPTRESLIYGQLHSEGTNQCLDNLGEKDGKQPGLYQCHKPHDLHSTQIFLYTRAKNLRQEYACMACNSKQSGSQVILYNPCEDNPTQRWTYNQATHQFVHEFSQLCLDFDKAKTILADCSENSNQKWHFSTFNASTIAKKKKVPTATLR